MWRWPTPPASPLSDEVRPGCVMALAVFFGKTRLIDNLWLK